MTAAIIDGKAFAADLRARVAAGVPAFEAATGRKPGLAVVLVGDDPASHVYVRNKGIATREAGMASYEHRLPAETSEAELLALVRQLNEDDWVDGILVQLPAPAHIREIAVIETIDPAKDVDGLHPVNAGRLAAGRAAMVPCTPLGCLMLLKDRLGDLSGLDAVVVGRSNLVGKPMAQLLTAENCTVTVAHSRTKALSAVTRRADILVAAVGRPNMITGDWIKPGATVIDIGLNRIPTDGGKTKLVGDVAFDEAMQVAGAVTPVPGGVGQMTVACLLVNTLRAACAIRGLPKPGV